MTKQREVITRSTDVGEFGEKDQRGTYDGPLNIAGELVDVDGLPAVSENDKPKSVPRAPVRPG